MQHLQNVRVSLMPSVTLYHWEPNANSGKPMLALMDQWLGPSFSMIGWKVFVGPAVASRDPALLKAAIERIPLPERRVAWRKAISGEFGAEELEESQRRVALGIRMLEQELGKRP